MTLGKPCYPSGPQRGSRLNWIILKLVSMRTQNSTESYNVDAINKDFVMFSWSPNVSADLERWWGEGDSGSDFLDV